MVALALLVKIYPFCVFSVARSVFPLCRCVESMYAMLGPLFPFISIFRAVHLCGSHYHFSI